MSAEQIRPAEPGPHPDRSPAQPRRALPRNTGMVTANTTWCSVAYVPKPVIADVHIAYCRRTNILQISAGDGGLCASFNQQGPAGTRPAEPGCVWIAHTEQLPGLAQTLARQGLVTLLADHHTAHLVRVLL